VPAPTLKELLESSSPHFFAELVRSVNEAGDFGEVLRLCTFRKHGLKKRLIPESSRKKRVAIIGGANLRPLSDFIQLFLELSAGVGAEIWVGEFDNYISEILEEESPLYEFKPDIVLMLPAERRCSFIGSVDSSRAEQETAVRHAAQELLDLAAKVHERCGAEVVLGNFRLSPFFDPGPLRNSSLISDYAFRRAVNTELGLSAPAFVHICDIEFLSNRRGNLNGEDDRKWFESKQPYAAPLLVDVAREFAHVASRIGMTAKKVLVLDLDNTLWGGVIGDDGLEGIEIGTTSPRGEAFKDFQKYMLSLSRRGVLLAVCSKNDHEKAIEPFEKHPEMVLRMKDIVSFKANWEPKSENIRQMAAELNLGLDSFVFMDDNRAEIEIVNQFVPEVATIWAGDDPSQFAPKLKDSRYFEMRSITAEDAQRAQLYKQETERQQLLSSATDFDAYLASLDMAGQIHRFNRLDAPRIAQLIARSNQFNLTTRRRSEAEVAELMDDASYAAFTIRLSDRFGDHGLIAIVIGKKDGTDFHVDTWLMSCRVLKRQVEEETLNEIHRSAQELGCTRVVGCYIPTAKNGMVRELYPKMGFSPAGGGDSEAQCYDLDVATYIPIVTRIDIRRESHATAGGSR
jgi:FkbH-like protein